MTKEQEIVWYVFGAYLNDLKAYSTKPDRPTFKRLEEVRDRAIKALEQQPCEDAVSRQALIDKATSWDAHFTDSEKAVSLTDIMSLPSVTPKYTDEEIQKIQELEQAQLEKAYELGMQTSFEEWLASFNTESATECFTAVQELKKRLESENND